jgi:hypothetical protein
MLEDNEYLEHIPTAYRIMRSNQEKTPQVIVKLLQKAFPDKSGEWITELIDSVRKAME